MTSGPNKSIQQFLCHLWLLHVIDYGKQKDIVSVLRNEGSVRIYRERNRNKKVEEPCETEERALKELTRVCDHTENWFNPWLSYIVIESSHNGNGQLRGEPGAT